ncbi:TonB-dependent receptor [candidate division KSB1 bacterium]|nr:TonB-dependent receptor [candidate division KSB1 bacterium]
MKRCRLCTIAILVIFQCIINNLLLASESKIPESMTGEIHGSVIDETTKRPLPAVNIMIEGTQMGAASDMEGRFVIQYVPIGSYNLRFRMMGYEMRIVSNVPVTPKRTSRVDIELKPTVVETEGVVVTAGYFHEAKDAVISNRSMDFEEIRSDPGSAEDVQRVVQALPSVVSGADQDNEIIVRGGMPGENLFVMDNIEIPNPNHFGYQGTGGGPINMVNTYFVRKVDFYAGAFPARYGDKASSVMDISLRDGNREEYAGQLYLGMSGAGAMAEGPIAKGKGAWIVSARKSFLDLIISSTGLTAVPRYYSLQGKATYDFTSNQQLIVNGIFGDDDITIEDDNGGYSRGAENVHAQSYQYATGATLRSLFSNNGIGLLTASQTLNNWDIYVYDDHDRPYYTNLSDEIERTLKYDYTLLPNQKFEINSGVGYKAVLFKHDEWAEADTIYIYANSGQSPQTIGIAETYPEWHVLKNEHSYKLSAYASGKYHPIPQVTLTAGLRCDYFKYIDKNAIDPRVGISYQLNDKIAFNLAAGQQSQSPAYIEVTASPKNNDLDYKKTSQIIGGFEFLPREDTKATVELFYKDYRHVPIDTAWTTPDPYDRSAGRMISEGKGFAKGVEFFIQKKMSHNFHFTISYAYSISKGYDPRLHQYYNWDYDYRHMFTFISGVRLNFYKHHWYQKFKKTWIDDVFGWILPMGDQNDISLRWRYLGGRPNTERTYIPQFRYWITETNRPFNTERYPEYFRIDLRIDSRYMFNGWTMVTYFDLMNVFNRDNVWGYSYKDNGTVDEILQWKVFPVGGVAIEF